METTNSSQTRLVYNPQLQSAEMTEKLFVVRQKQFNLLLNNILKEKENSIPQHHLIIGQRGMGKTMLLKRMEVELHKEQYQQQFIPLIYREEQYSVKDLAEFWLNTLDALADSLEYEKYPAEMVVDIDKIINELSRKTPKIISEEAYKVLMNICHNLQRRPVLLIDNIDIVFSGLDSNNKTKQEQWALRKLLSENGAPIIIGGGVTTTDDIVTYEMPFFDFFKIQYLKKLDYEEFIELLNNLASVTNSDVTVFETIRQNTSRQKALLELTGGSPRVTVILFDQIAKGFSTNINDDLNVLADAITPLYKAKFEELSQQQRTILDAIALNWDAISLRKLSSATRMQSNQLSPQLKRLVDDGWIETTPAYKDKGNAYFISERFFNIYYLIRNSSRRHKDKIYCLSKFLECFYGKEELEKISDSLSKEEICTSEQMRLHIAFWNIKALKKHLRQKGQENIFKAFLRKENEKLRKEFDFPEETFLIVEGDRLLKENKYEDAIRYFKEVLKLNSKNEMAQGRIGEILHALGQYEEAISSFDKILKANPTNAAAWIKEGEIFSNFERYDDAIKCFDKALEINPKNTLALGRKGEVFNELEEYEKAIDCFNEILKTENENCSAWIQKGEIFDKLKEYDNAIDCLNNAIKLNPKNEYARIRKGKILNNSGNYEGAILCLDEVLQMNSENEIALEEKGNILNKLEKYDEAIEYFNNVIKLNPERICVICSKGEALMELQQFEDAITCFSDIIKLNCNCEKVWTEKGKALVNLQHFDEAIKCFDEAIKINPKKGLALEGKGEALRLLEKYDDAIECFDKAIELNPEKACVKCSKGFVLMRQKRFDEAIACCSDIKIDCDCDFFWMLKGTCLFEMEQYEEALENFDKAIKLNSKEEVVWLCKAEYLLELKRYAEAIISYNEAIEINPKNDMAWNNKGSALNELQRYEEAIECCNKAIALNSKNDMAWSNKGYYLIELKNKEAAVIAYEKGRSINPKNLLIKFHLTFLYRDKLNEMNKAIEVFNEIEQEINKDENKKFLNRYFLNKTLFDLHNRNEGLAKEHLLQAFEALEKENKLSSMANETCWRRLASVVLDLGYGSWLLAVLEEKGYDIVLSPYYTAIQALEIEKQDSKNGQRDAEIYLKNRAVEISEPAREIIKKMRNYMD